MTIPLMFFLIIFCTAQMTQPVSIEIRSNSNKTVDLLMSGFILGASAAGLDNVFKYLQRLCQKKINKLENLTNSTNVQEIQSELNNRAFNFEVLCTLLYLPRIITTSATYIFPALTLLSVGYQLGKTH